ncbi:hypothetical protein [Marinomonas arenicola]|uniref:Glycosyltransferase RgtA/B/C/D-like domain-containing protein n=1 Tax=Marinomonas arenicola TaxID=569601 RepID=A0ABU9G6A5_9GAMM
MYLLSILILILVLISIVFLGRKIIIINCCSNASIAVDCWLLFFLIQILIVIFFRIYLPAVPDNEMFSSIIENHNVPVEHLGNSDILGFYYVTLPVSYVFSSDSFLYLIFQKSMVLLSLILFYFGALNLIKNRLNFDFSGVGFSLFLFLISIYPSFFIHYNTIIRESWEFFFFSAALYAVSKGGYIRGIFLFFMMVLVRKNSFVYFGLFVFYLTFLKSNVFYFSERVKGLLFFFFFSFFLCLFLLPPFFDYISALRNNKLSFFTSIGFSPTMLYPAYESGDLNFYFTLKSMMQYIIDPLPITSMRGSIFAYVESFFSFSLITVMFFIVFHLKKLSKFCLVFLLVFYAQANLEYFVSGGMRHRLIPYFAFIAYLSIILSPSLKRTILILKGASNVG